MSDTSTVVLGVLVAAEQRTRLNDHVYSFSLFVLLIVHMTHVFQNAPGTYSKPWVICAGEVPFSASVSRTEGYTISFVIILWSAATHTPSSARSRRSTASSLSASRWRWCRRLAFLLPLADLACIDIRIPSRKHPLPSPPQQQSVSRLSARTAQRLSLLDRLDRPQRTRSALPHQKNSLSRTTALYELPPMFSQLTLCVLTRRCWPGFRAAVSAELSTRRNQL
jgi:hypothetical protein